MALNKQILINGFSEFFDEEYSGFKGWPESLQDAVEKWGKTVDDYASKVTPSSTTNAVAKGAFMTTLLTISSVNDVSVIAQSIQSYGVALAVGMAPAFAGSIVGLPNLNPVAELGLNGGSSKDCIDLLSTIIDTWFRTGVAINTASGATILWT